MLHIHNALTDGNGRSSLKLTNGDSGLSASRGAIFTLDDAATLTIGAFESAGKIVFTSGGTATRMTLDSDGNLGVGVDSDGYKLELSHNVSNHALLLLRNTASHAAMMRFKSAHSAASDFQMGASINASDVFEIEDVDAGLTRIAINANGSVSFGGIAQDVAASDATGITINANDGIQMIDSRCGTTSNTYRMRFFNGDDDAHKGAIRTSGDATAFDTSSDYRMKENVVYDWDATTRLKQLKPCRFNWINDDTNTAIEGFLAHEAQTVVPNAVNGEKDATEEWANCVLNTNGQTVDKGVSEEAWTAGKSTTVKVKEHVVLDANGKILSQGIPKTEWIEGKSTTATNENGETITVVPTYASDTTWVETHNITVAAKYASDTTWAATHHTKLMQAIDHSWLVPLLCKTIQELEARITALEG